MALRRVVTGKHGCDPALRPVAGAVEQLLLGDQPDLAMGCQVQGEGESGETAADAQDVEPV